LPRPRYLWLFYTPPEPKSKWQPYLEMSSTITIEMPSKQSVSLVNYTNVGNVSNEFGTASIILSAPCLIGIPEPVDSAAEADRLVSDYTRDMTLKSQCSSTLALCENYRDGKLDQYTGNISHILIACLRGYRSKEGYYWALVVRRDKGSTEAEGCYKRSGILKFDKKSLHGCALWYRREVTIV
jgi:hypothetical protein